MKKCLKITFLITIIAITTILVITRNHDDGIDLQNSIWLSPTYDDKSVPNAALVFSSKNVGTIFLITDAPNISDKDGWPKNFSYKCDKNLIDIKYSYNSDKGTQIRNFTLKRITISGRFFLISPALYDQPATDRIFGGLRCFALSDLRDPNWEPNGLEDMKSTAGKSITKDEFLNLWTNYQGITRESRGDGQTIERQ